MSYCFFFMFETLLFLTKQRRYFVACFRILVSFVYFYFVFLLGKFMPHFIRLDKVFYSVFPAVLSPSYLQMLCCVALKGVWWKRKPYCLWINFLSNISISMLHNTTFIMMYMYQISLSLPHYLPPQSPLCDLPPSGVGFPRRFVWFPSWFPLLGLTFIVVFLRHLQLFNFLFWVNSVFRVT